jgi:hypothetical protein
LPAGALWCARCHHPVQVAAVAAVAAVEVERPTRPGEAMPFVRPRTRDIDRYAATDVTFGKRGRWVVTVLLTLPILWFLWLAVTTMAGFGITGLVTYGGVVYPKAMKDTWRRSDRL